MLVAVLLREVKSTHAWWSVCPSLGVGLLQTFLLGFWVVCTIKVSYLFLHLAGAHFVQKICYLCNRKHSECVGSGRLAFFLNSSSTLRASFMYRRALTLAGTSHTASSCLGEMFNFFQGRVPVRRYSRLTLELYHHHRPCRRKVAHIHIDERAVVICHWLTLWEILPGKTAHPFMWTFYWGGSHDDLIGSSFMEKKSFVVQQAQNRQPSLRA